MIQLTERHLRTGVVFETIVSTSDDPTIVERDLRLYLAQTAKKAYANRVLRWFASGMESSFITGRDKFDDEWRNVMEGI